MRSPIALLTLCALLCASFVNAFDPQEIDVEHFRPAIDREGIFGVESADVGQHLDTHFGLSFGLSRNPLISNVERAGESSRANYLVRNRTSAWLTASLSLFEWVELGIQMPFIVFQNNQFNSELPTTINPSLSSSGVGDLRIVTKIRLYHGDENGLSLALMPNIVIPSHYPRSSYMGEQWLRIEPYILLSHLSDWTRLVTHFGLRIRQQPYSVRNLVFGHEFQYAAALALRFFEVGVPLESSVGIQGRVQFFPELFATNHTDAFEIFQENQFYFTDAFSAYLSFSGGILQAPSVPDFRVISGVRVFFGQKNEDSLQNYEEDCDENSPYANCGFEQDDDFQDDELREKPKVATTKDSDGDGIIDAEDLCPLEPGTIETEGCPDADGDGVADEDDFCPKEYGEGDDGCSL
jgi:hypothetical protein